MRGGILLHDAIRSNCEKGVTTDIKVQVPSIWAKGVQVGRLPMYNPIDMTTPP